MLLDYDFLRKHTVVYQLNKNAISDVIFCSLFRLRVWVCDCDMDTIGLCVFITIYTLTDAKNEGK